MDYVSSAPAAKLKTNRGLAKFILLGILTLGIYPLVVMCSVSSDINLIASRYDGKKTMHYLLMSLLVGPITLGIYSIIWFHEISNRMGDELIRRGIDYKFNANTFWLWNVLGALILVGPLIYTHKMLKAMNLLSQHYNRFG